MSCGGRRSCGCPDAILAGLGLQDALNNLGFLGALRADLAEGGCRQGRCPVAKLQEIPKSAILRLGLKEAGNRKALLELRPRVCASPPRVYQTKPAGNPHQWTLAGRRRSALPLEQLPLMTWPVRLSELHMLLPAIATEVCANHRRSLCANCDFSHWAVGERGTFKKTTIKRPD